MDFLPHVTDYLLHRWLLVGLIRCSLITLRLPVLFIVSVALTGCLLTLRCQFPLFYGCSR